MLSMDFVDIDGDGLEDVVVVVKDYKFLLMCRFDEFGWVWEMVEILILEEVGNFWVV